MVSPTRRRPLPALVLLIALTLLTALVWWRVLHRDDGHASGSAKCPSPSASGSQLPRPASVAVSVLNSTNRAGIASRTAAKLTKLGFKVAGYGNDNPRVHVRGVAEIRFGPEQKDDAALLKYYFNGAKMVALKADPAGKVVVSLGDKYRGLATAAAAKAAMSSAHVSLSPASPSATATAASGSPSC
jgi:LytR cell envelope-related transcriptional attenuator